jgi:hypothetical protein
MAGFVHADDVIGPAPRHALPEAPRMSPLERARMWKLEREQRRMDQAHLKAAHRLERLGAQWRVVDWQLLDIQGHGGNRLSFLAIGPGGVFSVTIRHHGRSRVMMAGDVVQIDGRRPRYVAEARRDADKAAKALSRTAGTQVPVVPILAFDGTGTISVHGLPKGCVVTSYSELGHVLAAHGVRIGPETVDKLFSVAIHPATWGNTRYRSLADQYRWYDTEAANADSATGAR